MSSKPLPNVIFLDMDGVLCNPRSSLAVGNTGGMYTYLDPIACMLVKRLCEETNSQLVISSSWRTQHDQLSMCAILGAACPNLDRYVWQDHDHWRTAGYVFSESHNGYASDRGREIERWLEENASRYNNFCILDDMADMRPLQSKLVHCDVYDGMGWHQYHMAENLLMQGYSLSLDELRLDEHTL